MGSENGTLTVMRAKEGGTWATRGCFKGSLDDFARAVTKKHGTSKIAHEYRLLIEVACSRLGVPLPEAVEMNTREAA